ncbi:unnamed protein product [Caenorhabditis nigoni]
MLPEWNQAQIIMYQSVCTNLTEKCFHPESGSRNPDPGIRIQKFGHRNPGSRLRNSDPEIRNPDRGIRTQESVIRHPESGPRNPESGPSNPESGPRDSDPGNSEPGIRTQESGTGSLPPGMMGPVEIYHLVPMLSEYLVLGTSYQLARHLPAQKMRINKGS